MTPTIPLDLVYNHIAALTPRVSLKIHEEDLEYLLRLVTCYPIAVDSFNPEREWIEQLQELLVRNNFDIQSAIADHKISVNTAARETYADYYDRFNG